MLTWKEYNPSSAWKRRDYIFELPLKSCFQFAQSFRWVELQKQLYQSYLSVISGLNRRENITENITIRITDSPQFRQIPRRRYEIQTYRKTTLPGINPRMLNHYRNPHNNHSCATSVVASSLRIHRITRITRVNVNIKKKSKKYFLPSQKQNKYVFNKYIWHGRNSDNNKGIFIKKENIIFI